MLHIEKDAGCSFWHCKIWIHNNVCVIWLISRAMAKAVLGWKRERAFIKCNKEYILYWLFEDEKHFVSFWRKFDLSVDPSVKAFINWPTHTMDRRSMNLNLQILPLFPHLPSNNCKSCLFTSNLQIYHKKYDFLRCIWRNVQRNILLTLFNLIDLLLNNIKYVRFQKGIQQGWDGQTSILSSGFSSKEPAYLGKG